MNQETGAAKLERPLISGEVLLCKEENYGGQEQLITANTSRLDFPIASLRIGPKTGVTVFFEENYGGVSQELTAELPSFEKSRLPGNPKSIKIWLALDRPLISGEILLCKEENYGGQEQLINANTSRLDFPIASLRIGPKTGVTVFSDENYGGESQELMAELASVKESRLQSPAKSIKIWSLPGKPFTGYWAIGVGEATAKSTAGESTHENIENKYLSVAPDGVLTTSSSISMTEEFQFAEGFTGWASNSYLKQVTPVPPHPPGGKYRATANRVHLREGPGTGFRSLGYIQVNEIATDLGINDNGSWRQVLRHDGLRGWVSARYFTLLQSAPSDEGEPIPQDTTRKWVRVTAKLNVREGPGTNFTTIGSLQGGEVVEALEPNADGSWLLIRRTLDPAEAALGRRKVTLSVVADNKIAGQTTTTQSGPLSLGDFRNLTMVNEQEAGFRKFSLLSQDHQWIHYSTLEKHFLKSADAKDRTIFCQSIKIAADETQVGELLQGEVALYENRAYWGKAWVFHTSYADFNSVDGLNDEISSIQLGPLTGATIYRGAKFSVENDEKDYKKDDEKEDEKVVKMKGKQDVVSSLSSLELEQVGEDRISSIKLWQIKEPAALKLSFECRLSQDFRTTNGKFEEYSAYRTTLRLPPTVEEVEIWATDATRIWVDNQPHDVDETVPVKLDNPIRGMVITTDAVGDSGASLRTPGLKIRTNTMLPDERIMIYPDQQVHKDLANLKQGDLWNAKYKDKNGELQDVIKDRGQENSRQQEERAGNAQEMITKVMSTVQYSKDPSGGWQQTVSPPNELQNKGWVLHFLTYVVSADTLNLREGPGTEHKPIGFLERNDIVQALEFNADGKWVRVRRLKDDLTGWSSSAYLKTGDRYRVTASKLHFREGPGVDFPSLGYLEFNEIVTGIGVDDTGGWRQIRRSDGRTGWSAARYLALMQPLPPSPVPTAPSVVRFQEINQEQVQALRAVAQSPDTGLSQGLDWLWGFTEIVEAVRNAITVTAAVIENSLHFIIELADNVIHWVVDTAENVIAFVEGIFGAIGAAIEDVIKWLRFVFDWGDILKTRERLQEYILQFFEDLDHTLAQAQKPVERFFADQKHSLINQLDETIVALGGNVYKDAAAPNSTPSDSSNGLLNSVDWILSKVLVDGLDVMSLVGDVIGVGNSNASETKEDIELRTFCDETIRNGMVSIGAIPQGMLDVFNTLVKNPDKPLLVVAKLLELFRDQVVRLINAGEGIVLGLLKIMTSLMKKILDILKAKISIPFISDICKWITESGLLKRIGMPDLLDWMGKSPGTLPFSLLDAITLIIAVPSTIFYKAVFGKTPFQDVQALAPLALEVADPDPNEKALGVMGAISSAINGVLCAIVDGFLLEITPPNTKDGPGSPGKPENPLKMFLEMCSFVLSVISWLFSIYGRIKELALQKASTKFEWICFTVEGALLWINAASTILFRRTSKPSKPEPLLEDDEANTLTGAFGLLHAQFFIVKSTTDPETSLVWDLLPGIAGILPEIASFLKLPVARSFARYVLVPVDLLAAGAAVFSIFAPDTP